MQPLAKALAEAAAAIITCPVCGNVDTQSPCTICRDARRDASILVVVEEVGDLWALERAGATRGKYHVLGGVLSPLDGIGPDDLNIGSLDRPRARRRRLRNRPRMNATVEGQTTAHYITDQLAGSGAK